MKKSKHFRSEEIKIPIYTGSLLILNTNSISKIRSIVGKFKRTSIYAHSLHFDDDYHTYYTIIFNFNDNALNITHGVIAHEAYHIASAIADHHGILMTADNDEPLAYLMEWIVSQIYEFVDKYQLSVSNTIRKHQRISKMSLDRS